MGDNDARSSIEDTPDKSQYTKDAHATKERIPKHNVQVIQGEDVDEDVLQVTVQLPLVKSIAAVDLEVEDRSISLKVEDVYELYLELAHTIDENSVQARFDKTSKELFVSAPVQY